VDSNRFKYPRPGLFGRLAERIANSSALGHIRRQTMGRLPFPLLISDVVNVVYATWLVDADRARHLAPHRAALWEHEGRTPFTILTYRHGHFGPRATGPFRRLFASPLQSNWRLYLSDPLPGAPALPTVVFVKNVLSSALYALGTRVLSDALPSHLARRFTLSVDERSISASIEPGDGSAPALEVRFGRAAERSLPEVFAPFADSWSAAAARIANQDAAVTPLHGMRRVALGTIDLPADLDSLEPLQLIPGSLRCPMLRELGAGEASLCFLLPSVRLRILSDRLLPSRSSPAPRAAEFADHRQP